MQGRDPTTDRVPWLPSVDPGRASWCSWTFAAWEPFFLCFSLHQSDFSSETFAVFFTPKLCFSPESSEIYRSANVNVVRLMSICGCCSRIPRVNSPDSPTSAPLRLKPTAPSVRDVAVVWTPICRPCVGMILRYSLVFDVMWSGWFQFNHYTWGFNHRNQGFNHHLLQSERWRYSWIGSMIQGLFFPPCGESFLLGAFSMRPSRLFCGPYPVAKSPRSVRGIPSESGINQHKHTQTFTNR